MDLLSFAGIAAGISLLVINIRYRDISPKVWTIWEIWMVFFIALAGTIFWVLIIVLLGSSCSEHDYNLQNSLALIGSLIMLVVTFLYLIALFVRITRFPSREAAAEEMQPGFDERTL